MEAGRAPSPPQILLRLLQLVDDDCTTMGELARLVEQDPGLCTRVLTAANSTAIRRGNQLRSIEGCLISLGTRLVRSIATCLSVQSLFDERSAKPAVDLADFWTHSLLVAELSRGLATAIDYPRVDEAYLAGLLHDVGELIMLSALGESYAQLLAACDSEAALSAMEVEKLGVHHGEIGTWLADQWHLDSSFADGILFHHLPAEQMVTAAPLVQVVWLAHALAGCEEVSDSLRQLADHLFGQGSGSRLAALCAQAVQRTSMVADAIGIATPAGTERGKAIGLPHVLGVRRRSEPDTQGQIASLIGNKALLQPLQDDLFALETDAEVCLALRESARILFDLSHLAFLLCDPADGKLTGQGIAGQAAVFGQVRFLPEGQRSLAAVALLSNQIRSSYDRDVPLPNSLLDLQFARALASNGLLCVPLVGHARTVGVLVAGLSGDQHAVLARRLPCLANFGRIAGISLDNWYQARDLRRQVQEEASVRFARQSRRMVHEAGNPLTIIKGYLRILDGKIPAEVGVRHELKILTEEIERVSSIVRRMSEFPATPTAERRVDVGDLIRELLLLYREPLFDARGLVVETLLAPQTLHVDCDRDSIKQILLNLLKNASEALSPGQRLRLSLTDQILHQGHRFVELRIEDNGPGMSEAAISALYRPAAERLGGGRGIGLSIVGALAQRLGIQITCRSSQVVGTMISLLLPTGGEAEVASSKTGKSRQKTISSPDIRQE